MGTVEIDGQILEYEWSGELDAPGPTLVFLHHGLGCWESWKDFPDKLCRITQCRGLVFTRAGYGKSCKPTGTWDRDYLHHEARTVLPELVNKLEIQNHFLIGHSDGASIALIYASLTKNKLLQGLVCEAPHVFVEDVTISGIEAASLEYEHGSLREKLKRYHGENTDFVFRRWSDTWRSPWFRDWNIEAPLSGISVPVLAIQGIGDPYGTEEQIQSIQRNAAGPVSVCLLDACGHAPHRELESTVLTQIREFIGRVVSQG